MKNINCYVCGKEKLSKREIGITKKIIGRDTKNFYCLDCLAEQLEMDKDRLIYMIEQFEEEGCNLFS